MSSLTLFIGSSSAGKAQAKALVKALRSELVSFLPWWEVFKPGSHLMDNLDSIKNRLDGAVLVFSPEEAEKIEKAHLAMPSMNILFEFCYLYGHLGKGKVAMIKYGDYYIPPDFGGYIWIAGSPEFTSGHMVEVGADTKAEFLAWTKKLRAFAHEGF